MRKPSPLSRHNQADSEPVSTGNPCELGRGNAGASWRRCAEGWGPKLGCAASSTHARGGLSARDEQGRRFWMRGPPEACAVLQPAMPLPLPSPLLVRPVPPLETLSWGVDWSSKEDGGTETLSS